MIAKPMIAKCRHCGVEIESNDGGTTWCHTQATDGPSVRIYCVEDDEGSFSAERAEP